MSVPADVRPTRAAHCLMKRRPMFMMQGRSALATPSLRKATHQRQLPQLDFIPIDCRGKSADLSVQQGDGDDLFLLLDLLFLTITHLSLAAAAAAVVVESFAFLLFLFGLSERSMQNPTTTTMMMLRVTALTRRSLSTFRKINEQERRKRIKPAEDERRRDLRILVAH